jgi:hypothetical protein
MRKAIVLLAAAMAAVFGAAQSTLALDSGSNILSRDQAPGSTRSCDVSAGRICYFGFDTANTGNSAVFFVPTTNAVACIDGDVSDAAASSSSVKFWSVVSAGTKAGSFVPAAATSSTLSDGSANCFTMPTGLWWIEVVSIDGTDVGLLTITGRDSQ